MKTMKTVLIFVLSFFTIFIVNAQMPSAQLLLNGSDVGPEYTTCRGSIILSTGIGDATSTYYWQKTNQTGVTTDLGTTPTISLTPVEDFVKYGVYVNDGGTVYYDTLLLTVNNLPEVIVLNNTTSVCSSSDVIINATESPLPSHTYQWYVDGALLSNGGFYSGVTTYQLTVTGDVSLSGKRYECRVTASYGCSAYARTAGGQGTLLVVNPLPLNQTPTVNVPIVSGTATVCGLTTEIVIGLQATQSNYIYELYDADTDVVINTVVSPASPVDGAIQFAPQFVDRNFRIRVWDSTHTCSTIINQ
ncbi:MAG: hypothetical protein PHR61_04685 [Candidatus Absconditabacteria bacterium]|nr:hypothetical protein [Candidatus Absconditabacteria bacterium]